MIYLDNAATTQMHVGVFDAMLPYMKEVYGNPSSIHSFGRTSRIAVESARKKIAGLLACKPAEIFFTSGGTESINTCLSGAFQDNDRTVILTSLLEHHAVLHTVQRLEKQLGLEVIYVPVDEKGQLNFSYIKQCAEQYNKKMVVCLMAANNEIGTYYDTNEIGKICAQYGVTYVCDMVQTIGHYDVSFQGSNISMAIGSAHKFHGPQGIGLMYICSSTTCKSLLAGGGQERNMRAGTEYVAGIVGMATALELQMRQLEEDKLKIGLLKERLRDSIKKAFPDVQILGDETASLYTVLNVGFPLDRKTEMLIYQLDMNNIAVSSGSACSSGSMAVSHVVQAIGIKDVVPIRFSVSAYNTFDEMDSVVSSLKTILAE